MNTMKRKHFGILLMLAFTGSLSAQTSLSGFIDNVRFKKTTDGSYTRQNLKLSEIQGTPYLEDKFNPGKITTTEGTIYENISLRYNAFTDNLEFIKGNDSYNIDPKTIVKKAEFGGYIFSCISYNSKNKIQSGLFRMLIAGKATLLVKYSLNILEREPVNAYSEAKPARFDAVRKEYFLAFEGTPAELISNKKSLLGMFGAQTKEMELYISKNKLSFKDEDALTKIITHFNSL
jgi:hypothetical protein